jgi:hypothetical protein
MSRVGCGVGAAVGAARHARPRGGVSDFPLVRRDLDRVTNGCLASSLSMQAAATRPSGSATAAATRGMPLLPSGRSASGARPSAPTASTLSRQSAPDLVRKWDVTANAPLRLDGIKATYDKTVGWMCPHDPEHPASRMSPFTRAKPAGRVPAVPAEGGVSGEAPARRVTEFDRAATPGARRRRRTTTRPRRRGCPRRIRHRSSV